MGVAVGDGAVGEAGGSRDAEAAAAAAERTGAICCRRAIEHRSHGRREGRARHGSSQAKGLQRRAWHASGGLGAHHLLRLAPRAPRTCPRVPAVDCTKTNLRKLKKSKTIYLFAYVEPCWREATQSISFGAKQLGARTSNEGHGVQEAVPYGRRGWRRRRRRSVKGDSCPEIQCMPITSTQGPST